LAGHSLGEYNALFAAKVFDFATGLKFVVKRGELMGQAQGGAMVAIIGLSEQQIHAVLEDNKLQAVTIANKNSRTQFVLTGAEPEVMKAKELCEANGALLTVKLNVSGAFHSRYMLPAQQKFETFVNDFELASPQIHVIANCTARPYQSGDQTIKKALCDQITHSVLWVDSIGYLLSQNVTEFVEMGPGRVLTGLISRIKNGQ